MTMNHWTDKIETFDERRDIVIPGNTQETLTFSVEQFLAIGNEAINHHGFFSVALSGGQTPNSIYKALSSAQYKDKIDWTKVLCFWSDERSVPPTDSESNYHNAMAAGLQSLPLLPEHIFRMHAESDIDQNAAAYEAQIRHVLPSLSFDLIMLGMGEDGHTASLFPKTHGLHVNDRLVIANFVPQMHTWRMTMTFECINAAQHINIYALGKKKADRVYQVLTEKLDLDHYPVQNVGTPTHKALWILDQESSEKLA